MTLSAYYFLQSDEWLKLNQDLYGAKGIEITDNGAQYFGLGIYNDNVLSIIDGPNFRKADNNNIFKDFTQQLSSFEKKLQPKKIYIQFPCASQEEDFAQRNSTFLKSGFKKSNWLTSIVDLTIDKEKFFMEIEHSARKAIKKCQKNNLIVKRCTQYQEFIDNFCKGYLKNSDKEWSDDLQKKYDYMWSLQGKIYQFFYIELDGDILATLGAFQFSDRATEIMSSISINTRQLKLPAQDLLHWECFNFYRDQGLKEFDLAGYSPSPSDPREIGIMKFKKKWNGEEKKIDIFTKEKKGLLALIKSFMQKAHG